MSFLAQAFRSEMKKTKDPNMINESTFPTGYPTTFLPFDYMNGMLIKNRVMGSDITYEHESIGLTDGSINSLIGKAGSAKSSFAASVMVSIVSMFKDSVGIYDDLEGGMSLQRLSNVTGVPVDELASKIIHRNVGISGENFFERVKLHCKNKIEASISNPDIVMYNTGYYDVYGEPVYKLIPTVYVLDSLALLVPQDLTEDEKVKGQMAATAAAKLNAQIFKRLAPQLKAANVILLLVNHINEAVNISFIPKAAQINYLAQDETVPGGFMSLYLSNNIIKFTASTKLKEEDGMGINGFISKLKLIKSRSNRAGREVELVFNQDKGFDRILSCYHLLKKEKLVKGGGKSFYIEGLEDVKFSQKGFYKKFLEEPRLRKHMMDLTLEVCREMLPTFDEDEADISKNELIRRLNDAFADE